MRRARRLLVAVVDLDHELVLARGLLEFVGEQALGLDDDLPRSDLDGRLGALWQGLVRRDIETGDAWLLLEFELWLHAAREPEMGVVGAGRFDAMREGLAGGLTEWSEELGFDLPSPPHETAGLVIALLLGAAFQYRLDPSALPQPVVVAGLRNLLGLGPAFDKASALSA